MSKLKVTTISDPDNNNTALTVASDGKVTLAQDTTFSSNVGIGTSSPSSPLTINRSTDGDCIEFETGGTIVGKISTDSGRALVFDADPVPGGAVATTMRFNVDNSEAMRIDSSGNLLVGKTSADLDTEGAELRSNGIVGGTVDGGASLWLNRTTSDGAIAMFSKDGTTVGSIGSRSGVALTLNSQSASGRLAYGGTERFQWNDVSFIPLTDNDKDLGVSSLRWNDLYLGGGVYVGGTGSANYLDDYEEGTFTPTYSGGSMTVTYDIQLGRYTKVGNLVTCYVTLFTNTVSGTSSSANLSIQGLPFTAKSDNGQLNYTGTVGRQYRWNSAFNSANRILKVYVEQNQSYIDMLENESNDSLINRVKTSELDSTNTSYRNNIDIVISYLVA